MYADTRRLSRSVVYPQDHIVLSQKFCRNRIALLDKPTVAAGMMQIVGECVRATGTATAVLVGAGVPAGAKHN